MGQHGLLSILRGYGQLCLADLLPVAPVHAEVLTLHDQGFTLVMLVFPPRPARNIRG